MQLRGKEGTDHVSLNMTFTVSANKTGAGETTGSPSSLGTVNVTLHDSVIIRACMGNISIVRNSSK